MKHRARIGVLWLSAGVLLPQSASAHLVGVELGAFYSGSLHVLYGVEYLAVLMGMVLLCALHPKTTAGLSFVVAPVGAAIGCALSLLLGGGSDGLLMVFALAGLIGVFCALALPLPRAAFAATSMLGGMALGYSNAQALNGSTLDAMLYTTGVVAAVLVTLSLAAAVGTWLREQHDGATLVYRVLGSWIAAFGCISLALGIATA
ncbi:MAG: hypothetical protein AAFQ59_09890 [Pseudomonadota bacterium]